MSRVAEALRRSWERCAVLALALRHPRTPWHARVVGGVTLAYALSPIDLIPDFIPVLGYLDDLVLVPLGIWVTMQLIPDDVWTECAAQMARDRNAALAKDWRGALLVGLVWLALLIGGAVVLGTLAG